MATTNILNSYQSLVATFSDFLTVAIHTILFERAIYPPSTFITTRKYNFPVRQNRHPKVCQWINDAVDAVAAQLLQGVVSRVVVVIFSKSGEVMERFIFDVSGFPKIPAGESKTEFEVGDGGLGISLVDVEEQLRAGVRKLAYCGNKLKPLPEGCTYTVAVELRDEADPPIGHPQPWIPSAPNLQTGEKGKSKEVGKDLGGAKSVPVRTVEAGEFVLEMWIEEGKSKQHDTG